MSNRSPRRVIPVLLTLFALTFLPPTLATARPLQHRTGHSARPRVRRGRPRSPRPAPRPPLYPLGRDPPTPGTAGDNGSGLDPDGRH